MADSSQLSGRLLFSGNLCFRLIPRNRMAPLLELEHLFDALKGFKRPLREGRLTVENIVCVGIRSRSDTEVNVEALCLRTTKIHEDPVKILVSIARKVEAVDEKIKSISCGCTAGSCKEHCCKHAMAVLIYLERHDETQLEMLTCTDVEQLWGGLQEVTLSKFDAIPLKDFCHMKQPPSPYKRPISDITKEMLEEFRAMFLADQPDCEAAVFLSGMRAPPLRTEPPPNVDSTELKSILKDIYESPHYILKRTAELTEQYIAKCSDEEIKYYNDNVKVSADQAMKMCLDTLEQDNDLWDQLRSNRFTGTRIYPTYTYSKNPKANWDKRFDSMFNSSFNGNDDTMRGLKFEEDSRNRYALEKCGNETKMLTSGIVISPLAPWVGFSPDGLICEGGKVIKLFETKCPKPGESRHAEEAVTLLKYVKSGKLAQKHTYYGQIQLGMLLLNTPICDFTIYSSKFDDIFVDSVVLDVPFVKDMLEKTCKIYFEKCLPWLVKQSKQ